MRRHGRLAVPLLLLPLLLAGCASPGEAPEAAVLEEPPRLALAGVVLAPGLHPLEGARVDVAPGNLTATAGPDGTYRVDGLAPGAYTVTASAVGHHAAKANVTLAGAPALLNFTLEPVPEPAPLRWETQELAGYISCGAMATLGGGHGGSGEEGSVSCGEENPNDERDLTFLIPVRTGLTGIVVEVVWEPRSSASKHFAVSLATEVDGEELEIGGVHGASPLKHVVSTGVIQKYFAMSGTLTTHVHPEGSVTDDESPTNAAVVYDQPYTVYVTTFENGPVPPGFSALRDAEPEE